MASEAAKKYVSLYRPKHFYITSEIHRSCDDFDAGHAAGAAAMRELMSCGHPKVCMVEDVPSESERPTLHCSECLKAAASEKSIAELQEQINHAEQQVKESFAEAEFVVRKRIAALEEALQKLLDKLDLVDKATLGAFQLAHIHGMPYQGPNWSEEYKAGRATRGPEGGDGMKDCEMNDYWPKGYPKDKCDLCKKQVGECQCESPNGHPMGCSCRRCGPPLKERSPWSI